MSTISVGHLIVAGFAYAFYNKFGTVNAQIGEFHDNADDIEPPSDRFSASVRVWLIAIALVAWLSSGSTEVCNATSALVTPWLVDALFLIPVFSWVFAGRFLVGDGTDFIEFVNQMCFAPVVWLLLVAAIGVAKRWIRRRSVLGIALLVALAFCIFSAPVCHWEHRSMTEPWLRRVNESIVPYSQPSKSLRASKGCIIAYGAIVLLSEMPFLGNLLMRGLQLLSSLP